MKQLAYQKLMADNQITLEELPNDAKHGIKELSKVVHAMAMTENRGQRTKPETIEKIKRNDKWLVREILDYMEDKDSDQGAMPIDFNEIINEIENQQTPEEKAKFEEGVTFESEMDAMVKSGKSAVTIDEIKSLAPKCYRKIFATYEDGQPNGIVTSKFSLLEDQSNKQTFTLKSK
jgi:hypothetical protein